MGRMYVFWINIKPVQHIGLHIWQGQVCIRWLPAVQNRMYQIFNVSWVSQLELTRLVFYSFLWFYHQNFLQNRWLDFNQGVSGKQIRLYCGWPPISPVFWCTYCGPHMHFSLCKTLYSTHILETPKPWWQNPAGRAFLCSLLWDISFWIETSMRIFSYIHLSLIGLYCVPLMVLSSS